MKKYIHIYIFVTSTLTHNTVKCFKQPCDSALLNKRLPLCKMKFLATSREGGQTVTQQKSSGRVIHEFQEMFHIETCAMHGQIHTQSKENRISPGGKRRKLCFCRSPA